MKLLGTRRRNLSKYFLGLCSARLHAGMSLNLPCRPEGRRYKSVSRMGCHTDSYAHCNAFRLGTVLV
jgi:hypothetical protein